MNKKGQVTLLAVILGVLGLTLGLAVTSRSLTDLKQASTVDFGTKALAAAEAGAEFGLSQINLGPVNPDCVPKPLDANALFPQLGIIKLDYALCASPYRYARSDKAIPKDGVFQIDLKESTLTGEVRVGWSGSAWGVQINALYFDGTEYRIDRYAYKDNGGQLSASNFTTGTTMGAGLCGDASFPAGRRNNTAIALDDLVLLRITPIGGSADVIACSTDAAVFLPTQYYEVKATAETTNGTVKKVSVRRDVSGTLPGIFDNVLFSGGNITKS